MKMDPTIDYYNLNAENFIQSTQNVDMHLAQDKFLHLLNEGAVILDFGCGSGRDTKYFLDQGYQVTATDGSAELCRLASVFTGIEVQEMLFQELDDIDTYDGIWACSSILHLPLNDLILVMKKIESALKNTGVLYTSFKYGDYSGERNGRYFTDMTEDRFDEILQHCPSLHIIEIWQTGDVRQERENEKWLNILLRKIN